MAKINPLYPITELTQAQYDALDVKDANTLYAIPFDGVPPSHKTPASGNTLPCVLITQADYDALWTYDGNTLYCIGHPEPVYDETKIAVIELDESGKPTDNVEYFEASSTHGEPASSEYIKANTDKNYFLRFGTNSMNGMIDGGYYNNCANIKQLMLGCVTALAEGCFSGCTGLENLYIPDNVKYIYKNAFAGCTSLQSVRIPKATMGDSVFAACIELKTVTFADDVEAIAQEQFAMCRNIESIQLPDALTDIYRNAFAACTSLSSIEIPSAVSSIGTNAFAQCTSLTEITINKPENSISGAPWGAPNATVVWTG